MKKLLLSLAILGCVLGANAQAFTIMNFSSHSYYKEYITPGYLPVCYPPEMLDAISKEMYDAGNDHYIFVDLLKDGLIKENQTYNFYLDFDAKPYTESVSAETQKRYADKWMSFVQQHSGKKEKSYSYQFAIIKPGELLNPKSSFRQLNKYSLWQHGFRQKEYKYIIQEILMDKLAEPEEKYSFELSNKVMKINGRTVLEPLRSKYYALYKDLIGIDVSEEGHETSMHGDGTMYGLLLKE